MTEVEKRRIRLLQDVRKNYSNRNTPPAIHPRYSSTYHSLYQDEFDNQIHSHSMFFLRVIVAALIFAFVFVIDYNKEEIANVSSQSIINEVQKDLLSQ